MGGEYLVAFEGGDAAAGIVVKDAVPAEGEPFDFLECTVALEGSDELPEGDLTLSLDQEVDLRIVYVGIDFRGETWIVPADDDPDIGLERADEIHDRHGGAALEGHDGEADQLGVVAFHELANRFADRPLCQYQIGNRHLVVGIDVSGQ